MSKLNWWKTAWAVFLLCEATAITLPAQTLTTLQSFDGRDGSEPVGLVQATDGNFYGTAYNGGAYDGGTVFKITPSGSLTMLHSFDSMDGRLPAAELIQGTDGNLYGTTSSGGANGKYGTVFKITPSGTLTTLYSFCSQSECTDGLNPYAGLVQATDGNFYGTTAGGGANYYGTVFKITPGGALTTLYSFCPQRPCIDGFDPVASLIQATDGNFYGTTWLGGSNNSGTVFKITPSGTLTTLYSFCSQGGSSCTDGANPGAALLQASDGNFYGTTSGGGHGYGTVFKITPGGALTMLYSFCSQGGSTCTDGSAPGGLLQATDGNLYGTTHYNAPNSWGTVFEISLSGSLTTIYSFCSRSGCADGRIPDALIQDTTGDFYGTTSGGGATADGTVFSLSVGLGPFVETEPDGGKVGARIKILGTNLTGATSVTFNGTPATFTVEASSVIKATVPAGATTGTVQVVTPSGTLSSNVPFRVAP